MPFTESPFYLLAVRHGREAAMPFIMVTVLIDMMSWLGAHRENSWSLAAVGMVYAVGQGL